MLLLTRRVRDKGIVVELPNGQILEIFVQKIFGRDKQVSIGFRNEDNLKVWRGEVYDKILEERKN